MTRLKYRVHRFDVKMSQDQERLEEFLNRLEGELVTIIPNVMPNFTMAGWGQK